MRRPLRAELKQGRARLNEELERAIEQVAEREAAISGHIAGVSRYHLADRRLGDLTRLLHHRGLSRPSDAQLEAVASSYSWLHSIICGLRKVRFDRDQRTASIESYLSGLFPAVSAPRISRVAAGFPPQMNARDIGLAFGLTDAERSHLGIALIKPVDVDDATLEQRKKDRKRQTDRARTERLRREKGVAPRVAAKGSEAAESGVSRSTLWRRRKREAAECNTKVAQKGDTVKHESRPVLIDDLGEFHVAGSVRASSPPDRPSENAATAHKENTMSNVIDYDAEVNRMLARPDIAALVEADKRDQQRAAFRRALREAPAIAASKGLDASDPNVIAEEAATFLQDLEEGARQVRHECRRLVAQMEAQSLSAEEQNRRLLAFLSADSTAPN